MNFLKFTVFLMISSLCGSVIAMEKEQHPIISAVCNNNVCSAKLWARSGYKHNSYLLLYTVIHHNNTQLAKLLIDNGADVNYRGEDKITPLMFAVVHGNKEIAEMLIENNADVNAQDDNGETALMVAALKGDINMLILLLSSPHINVDLVNNKGHAAINFAWKKHKHNPEFFYEIEKLINERRDRKITNNASRIARSESMAIIKRSFPY